MSDAERISRRDLLRRPFFAAASASSSSSPSPSPSPSVASPRSSTGPLATTVTTAKPTQETALILAWGCLAHRGTTCTICVEHCPVAGAIRIENGRPIVDEAVCTGCGDCATACPSPRRAIAFKPRRRLTRG